MAEVQGESVGFVKSVFSRQGAWSSKRVFGGLGLIIIFAAYIYAVYAQIELPECTEFLAATCASLLGVDAVVSAIRKE